MRHTTGSIFIFASGMLLVMVTMVYAFMTVARISRDSGRPLNLRSLAESAAQQGAAHALEVITRDYASQPFVPTHTNMLHRTAFAPIDTQRVNRHLADVTKYEPWGTPDSAEDENENDTKTESILTALYNSTYQGNATYHHRIQSFSAGRMLNPGLARYIEPGYYHSDMVGKPISFHLDHPTPADPSSPDPAVRRGENYLPDHNAPLYLDRDLTPVADRRSARFRLRYAVAVEELSGHLPLSFQGPYTDGVAGANLPAVTMSVANSRMIDEIDHAVGDRYADTMYNLVSGSRSSLGWMIAKGQGFGMGLYDDHSLSSFLGGVAQRWTQATVFDPPDTEIPAGRTAFASNRGPVATPGMVHAWMRQQYGVDKITDAPTKTAPSLCYTFTPYGRKPNVVGSGTLENYRDSYVDCPWQINLPTAVPEAVSRMVQAYLPREFRSVRYNTLEMSDFDGFDARGAARWKNTVTVADDYYGSQNFIDLFASSAFAPLFAHLGHPYPGTVPQATATASDPWISTLGDSIDLNGMTFSMFGHPSTDPREEKYTRPAPPFWGMDVRNYSYLLPMANNFTAKEEHVVGGQKWVRRTGTTATQQALIAGEGYWYDKSYWLDVAAAFYHAIGVAQLAWLADDGRAYDGNPLAGRPQYVARSPYPTTFTAKSSWGSAVFESFTNPYLLPLLSDGKPSAARDLDMLDRDADGDGAADSPSGFDTIEEVDRLFVYNLGEHWGDVTALPTLQVPAQGLYVVKDNVAAGFGVYPMPQNYAKCVARLIPRTTNFNILKLRNDVLAVADPANAPRQAALMELVVNDMRMSFFGASPNYPNFRGIDFDNDGTVRCSAYGSGSCPVAAGRFGRMITPASGDARFSLTGCFILQKSRFYRAFIRGEVVDTVRMVPVSSAALEVVYAIDPQGRLFDVNNAPIPLTGAPSTGPFRHDPDGDNDVSDADIVDSQVLYKRWHAVQYQGYGALATE